MSKKGSDIKIIPISDRSPEVLDSVVSECFCDDTARTLMLLQKVPNPFFVMDGSTIVGYLNLKQIGGTMYIPIYLRERLADGLIPVLLGGIKSILHKHEYRYFVLSLRKPISGFLGTMTHHFTVEDSVRDYRRAGKPQLLDAGGFEYQWTDAIDNVSALKALHADAYSYEKEYVVGNWDDLIDQFMSSKSPKITLCCNSGSRLIGSAIGYVYDTHTYIYSICVANEYQGMGVGSGLIRRFVNESKGKAIELRVYSNNESAHTMYEHFGFELVDLSSLVGASGSL